MRFPSNALIVMPDSCHWRERRWTRSAFVEKVEGRVSILKIRLGIPGRKPAGITIGSSLNFDIAILIENALYLISAIGASFRIESLTHSVG
jgi:hypothetical protein